MKFIDLYPQHIKLFLEKGKIVKGELKLFETIISKKNKTFDVRIHSADRKIILEANITITKIFKGEFPPPFPDRIFFSVNETMIITGNKI